MDLKRDEAENKFSEKNVFVQELILENIKLMKENIGLIFDNHQLVERVEELESTKDSSKGIFNNGIDLHVKFVAEKDNHNC